MCRFADHNETNDIIRSAFHISHPLEIAEELIVELKEEIIKETSIESIGNLSILEEAERILVRSWKEQHDRKFAKIHSME